MSSVITERVVGMGFVATYGFLVIFRSKSTILPLFGLFVTIFGHIFVAICYIYKRKWVVLLRCIFDRDFGHFWSFLVILVVFGREISFLPF